MRRYLSLFRRGYLNLSMERISCNDEGENDDLGVPSVVKAVHGDPNNDSTEFTIQDSLGMSTCPGSYDSISRTNQSPYRKIRQNDFIKELTDNRNTVIVHFFKEHVAQCAIVDAKLSNLASLHVDMASISSKKRCLFFKMDAKDAPFLLKTYKIERYPTVLAIQNGEVRSRFCFESGNTLKVKPFLDWLIERGFSAEFAFESGLDPSNHASRVVRAGYRTISQNEFLEDRSIGRGRAIIHFSDNQLSPQCRVIDTYMKHISSYHKSSQFLKIDAKDGSIAAAKYKIQTFPTVLALQHGQIVGRFCFDPKRPGGCDGRELKDWLIERGIEWASEDTKISSATQTSKKPQNQATLHSSDRTSTNNVNDSARQNCHNKNMKEMLWSRTPSDSSLVPHEFESDDLFKNVNQCQSSTKAAGVVRPSIDCPKAKPSKRIGRPSPKQNERKHPKRARSDAGVLHRNSGAGGRNSWRIRRNSDPQANSAGMFVSGDCTNIAPRVSSNNNEKRLSSFKKSDNCSVCSDLEIERHKRRARVSQKTAKPLQTEDTVKQKKTKKKSRRSASQGPRRRSKKAVSRSSKSDSRSSKSDLHPKEAVTERRDSDWAEWPSKTKEHSENSSIKQKLPDWSDREAKNQKTVTLVPQSAQEGAWELTMREPRAGRAVFAKTNHKNERRENDRANLNGNARKVPSQASIAVGLTFPDFTGLDISWHRETKPEISDQATKTSNHNGTVRRPDERRTAGVAESLDQVFHPNYSFGHGALDGVRHRGTPSLSMDTFSTKKETRKSSPSTAKGGPRLVQSQSLDDAASVCSETELQLPSSTRSDSLPELTDWIGNEGVAKTPSKSSQMQPNQGKVRRRISRSASDAGTVSSEGNAPVRKLVRTQSDSTINVMAIGKNGQREQSLRRGVKAACVERVRSEEAPRRKATIVIARRRDQHLRPRDLSNQHLQEVIQKRAEMHKTSAKMYAKLRVKKVSPKPSLKTDSF